MASAAHRPRIRLNLLPPEIPAAQRARRLLPLCVIMIVLCAVASLYWMATWKKAVDQRATALAEAEAAARVVTDLQTQTQTEKSAQEPLRAVIRFLDGFETYPSRYADVVEAIARYVPDTCTLDRIQVTSNSVTFSTVVEDTESLVKLIINLNRCAMPARGGGTEPLWSDDPVSRGALKRLFSGPIQVSGVTLNGMRYAGDVFPEGDVAAQLLSFGPAPSAAPTLNPGDSVYQNGMVWQAPIPVTITATLAEPITLDVPQAPAAAGADAAAAGAPAADGAAAGAGSGAPAASGGE